MTEMEEIKRKVRYLRGEDYNEFDTGIMTEMYNAGVRDAEARAEILEEDKRLRYMAIGATLALILVFLAYLVLLNMSAGGGL